MPERDERVYGFNESDADALIQMIGGEETTHIEGQVRSRSALLCRTGGSGIAARSSTTVASATCTVWRRSGTTISASTTTIPVYNLSTSAVAANAYIIASPTNIGYVAVWEDCCGGDGKLAITPAGGIAARTTTSVPHTFPSATCRLIDEVTGGYYTPDQTLVVHNSTRIAVAAGRVIQIKQIGTRYFVDVDGDC